MEAGLGPTKISRSLGPIDILNDDDLLGLSIGRLDPICDWATS